MTILGLGGAMSSTSDAKIISDLLPHRAHEIERLLELAPKKRMLFGLLGSKGGDPLPIVTVLGKYNHGKSKLLNEIIGREAFKVADIRQTVKLDSIEHRGVRWQDAPGLDADLDEEDDRLSKQSAWIQADLRLFVHSVKEGEFDAREKDILNQLRRDRATSGRPTLIVLTMIEQISEEQLQQVLQVIRKQASDFAILPVSSMRQQKGREEDKELLRKKSGFGPLRRKIWEVVKAIPQQRADETASLAQSLRSELTRMAAATAAKRNENVANSTRLSQSFERELRALIPSLQQMLKSI